jgi:hypothetical protein
MKMRRSKLNIDATLDIILTSLKYFKNLPSDPQKIKEVLERHSNIKHRMKLFVNDVYGHLERNEQFESGISLALHNKRNNDPKYKGIWEHTIPWEVFFNFLIKKNFTNTKDLYNYLKFSFCQCWITSGENKRLNDAKLTSKMPSKNWNWDDRYKDTDVKIVLIKKPVNPYPLSHLYFIVRGRLLFSIY